MSLRRAIPLVLIGVASLASADATLILKNDFIAKYKRRVTLSTALIVEYVIADAEEDGDLHFGGRSDEVSLPTIGELQHCKLAPNEKKLIKDSLEPPTSLLLKGVWRVWFEHPTPTAMEQGNFPASRPISRDLYKKHLFELHPVLGVNGVSTMQTVSGHIEGESPLSDAVTAIKEISAKKCQIQAGLLKTTITSPRVPYNYIDLTIKRIDNKVFTVDDGEFLYASLLDAKGHSIKDSDGHVLGSKVRLVLIGGSSVESQVKDLPKGGMLRVIVSPRISLSLIDWRLQHAGDPRYKTNPLNWTLPYELVVIARS
jgi:hypothetical protein